jgi:hypothetical protein
MLARVRPPLAVVVASVVLLLCTAVASAEGLTVEPAGSITASSLGSLSFRSPLATVTCPVTMTGSFESASSVQGVAGAVTSARLGSCSGATVTTSLGTPWQIVAGAALGTLPSSLTGLTYGFYNVSFLFDVTFFGMHVRCLYRGHIGTLTRLSGTNPYRTELLVVQARDQEFTLFDELDTTGLCPAGREVSASGELRLTTQNLQDVAIPLFAINPTPPVMYSGTEAKTIEFRNMSANTVRIRRVYFHQSSNRFTREATTCLEPGDRVKELAAGAICTVTVRFTIAAGDTAQYFATLRMNGDPADRYLGGALLRN